MACESKDVEQPSPHGGMTKAGRQLGDSVIVLLDAAKQEEAQQLLLTALDSSETEFNTVDRYFIHALLTEVMYYAAMNEQGLLSAEKTLQIALELQNSTFEGNAYNLIGIIHLNAGRNTEARDAFRKAIKLIPRGQKSRLLSRVDQVMNNLAEVYLNLQQPDSAHLFADSALKISTELDNARAICFAYWAKGEAFLQEQQPNLAQAAYLEGLNRCPAKETDVQLYLISGLLDAARVQKDPVKIKRLGYRGDSLLQTMREFDFARSRYLEKKTDALKALGNYAEVAETQSRLLKLNAEIRANREALNQRQLKAYFDNEKQLFLANQQQAQQLRELDLNRRIQVILGVLMVVLLLLLVLLRRWSLQKHKLERYRFEQQKLKADKERELELMHDRFTTLENERNRIARELHDDIGSSMSAISIFADLAAKEASPEQTRLQEMLRRTTAKAAEVSESLSDLIWAIYSKNDNWSNLVDRIRNFGFEILTAKGIEVRIEDDFSLSGKVLPINLKKNLLLISKEALNNIAKYSSATLAMIRFEYYEKTLQLRISDNGHGFDPESVSKGNGLQSMHNRARALQGQLRITSSPGTGTTIELSVPFSFENGNKNS
jgi:signal transduction histidine kinase